MLVFASTLATVVCVGACFVLNYAGLIWAAWLPAAIVMGAALFVVRGYRVTPDAIVVRRLLWANRLPLTDLQSARHEPDAMRRSIRLFGNGGLFSFTGLFRNSALGNYRAFVTDPRLAVVLRYERRTVVISPGAPEEFVRRVMAVAGGRQ